MKAIFISLLLSIGLTSFGQNKYPGPIEIRQYNIGQKVDTALFRNISALYIPNHLDGWTRENVSALPEKYKGLPIGMWQLKSDSSIVLTLLENVILNITVSYMTVIEKDSISKVASKRFGFDGKLRSYEETHPFQAYITYWNLKTWETSNSILEVGTSEMRHPDKKPNTDSRWNLVYSDFVLEREIIDNFQKR